MSQEDDDHPLNLVAIRVWDIDENSTHYDKMIAAPSDKDMKLMWIFWSLIMGLVAFFTGIVFIAILLDKKARKNPFNVYLLCLMVPDILMSFLCFITCWLNAATGHFYSEGLCYFQSFYFIFGIGANSWLNAIIARQLYKMLDGAQRFRRYKPPTRKMVVIDALKVYIFAAFVAAWGIIDQPWLPHKTGLVLGTACIPIDYNTASTIFFYCVFFPALMGIPMGYVMYVLYMIQKHNLMPPTGKRRLLALYFFRLAAVFVLMWLPALLFLFIVGAWVHHWIVWAGGAWSHMQGLVSTALSLMKPDIGQATSNFVTCNYFDEDDDEGQRRRASWFPSGAKRSTNDSLFSRNGLMQRLGLSQLSNDALSQYQHEDEEHQAPENGGRRITMTGEVAGASHSVDDSKLDPNSGDEDDFHSDLESDFEVQESTENSMSKEFSKENDHVV